MGVTQVPNTGSRKNIYPKYEIQQGPWNAGLDTSTDPNLLPTNALTDCVNFVIKPGGTLALRPPVNDCTKNLPASNYKNYVSALGSVITGGQNLVPFAAITDPIAALTTFYKYLGPITGWVAAFASVTPSDPTDVPKQVLFYNTKYFVLYSDGGILAGSSSTGTILALTGAPPGSKMLVLKDRIFVLQTDVSSGINDIHWSDANPAGAATDWSSTAPHTASNLGLNREDGGEGLRDMVVFDDALYICSYRRVYRLSFTNNPGLATDASLTLVSDVIGGSAMQVYNGNLYLLNGAGLYRLVSNYFVEVSGPVRNFIRGASVGLPPNLNFFTSAGDDRVLDLHLMGSKLLCGPFNQGASLRYNETPDICTGNVYLVYDLDLDIWYKWQFNPNISNPISGPSQFIMPSSINDPALVENWVWVGVTLVNGALQSGQYRQQSLYSMSASDMVLESPTVGQDSGLTGPQWIGAKFRTNNVDLGDSKTWKKFLTGLLDGSFFLSSNNFSHGNSSIGLNVDTGVVVPLSPADGSRLKFGGAYRFRDIAFFYDSLTGIQYSSIGPITAPELTDINRFSFYVTTSRKDIN